MITLSAKQTIELAKKFAKKLKGGEVIGLVGELGSGKTTFIKGLARGLGVKEPITSPTFVLLKEYVLPFFPHLRSGEKRLRKFVHIDAYRVETPEDIKSVGIEDYLGRKDMVMVIEWAEKIKKVLPQNTIYIKFEHIDKNRRKISIKKCTCVKK